MHHVTARKVQDTPGRHEAATPLPVAEGAVDEEVPDPDEDEHWAEAHALSKGPAQNLKKSMP